MVARSESKLEFTALPPARVSGRSALATYVGRIREFDRRDWLVYVAWVGLMLGLVLITAIIVIGLIAAITILSLFGAKGLTDRTPPTRDGFYSKPRPVDPLHPAVRNKDRNR